jgi:putative oxidoreductase
MGLAIRFQKFPDGPRSAAYGALFLRLVLTFFFLAHLYNKFFTKDGFWGWWGALTHRNPAFVPVYVLTVEFSCALLLFLGIRTRWVALYAVPAFTGIIAFWLKTGGYWFTIPGAEFPIMWMCLLLLKIILDDGAYALKIVRTPLSGA